MSSLGLLPAAPQTVYRMMYNAIKSKFPLKSLLFKWRKVLLYVRRFISHWRPVAYLLLWVTGQDEVAHCEVKAIPACLPFRETSPGHFWDGLLFQWYVAHRAFQALTGEVSHGVRFAEGVAVLAGNTQGSHLLRIKVVL